jgi:hypothetical protein
MITTVCPERFPRTPFRLVCLAKSTPLAPVDLESAFCLVRHCQPKADTLDFYKNSVIISHEPYQQFR